jgi:hypothetical protein
VHRVGFILVNGKVREGGIWIMNTVYVTTGCPTTHQTQQFFNNSKTSEDIAMRFEQEYVRSWEMKRNVSVVRFKFCCNILISGKIIK